VPKCFISDSLSRLHRPIKTPGIFLSIPLGVWVFFLMIPRCFLAIPLAIPRVFSMFHSHSKSKAILSSCRFSHDSAPLRTQKSAPNTQKDETGALVFLTIPVPSPSHSPIRAFSITLMQILEWNREKKLRG